MTGTARERDEQSRPRDHEADGRCPYPVEADIRAIRGHSGFDPYVWSGRAGQEVSSTQADAVLHQCIRPLIGAFALRAIMDISAHGI